MGAIPSNLWVLVEQLEDSRRFHETAARQSGGPCAAGHRAKSWTYAAMLAEIRAWGARAREHDGLARHASAGDGPDSFECRDSYAALLERIYRLHEAAPAFRPSIRICAADSAREGRAREGEARDGHGAQGSRAPGTAEAPAGARLAATPEQFAATAA